MTLRYVLLTASQANRAKQLRYFESLRTFDPTCDDVLNQYDDGFERTQAVVALEGGFVAGMFFFRICPIFADKPDWGNLLQANGTFVCGDYRGKSVGRKLWMVALDKYRSKIKKVNVHLVSFRAAKMMLRLKRRYKDIAFDVFCSDKLPYSKALRENDAPKKKKRKSS